MAITSVPASTRTPARHARAGARWPDAVAAGALLAIATAVYGLPSLLGHPVVPGDDLTQNLPLRELVGEQLRHGQLPLYDPYIWSGAPLLGGWNAGAAYPFTWLFAVLPAAVAWAVNLVVTAAVASVGCFAFLRASNLGVVASWLGGFTYAFAGAMAAQVTHLGLIVGMSWVPVALLALRQLTTTGPPLGASRASGAGGRVASWTAILALAIGLVVLAGEPRAIANAAVVLVIYATWRFGRLWRDTRLDRLVQARAIAWRASAGVAGGCLLGLGLGAVQLLPGLAAVATSQRAATSSYLFSAGSVPVRWLLLLGVPDLLGGSGSFGQPRFFAAYNLTEVTGYAGVLALVAAGALAGRLATRRADRRADVAVWYVVGLAGVVLALGNHTPLWHLFARLPLFGGLRLPSRSILVTDLALAVLLAHWVDGWLGARERAGLAERWGAAVPALVIVGVSVAAIADGPAVATWMGAGARAARAATALGPWLVPPIVLSVIAAAMVWAGAPWRPELRRTVAVSVVVADLVVFALATVVAVDGGGPDGSRGTRGTRGTVVADARGPRPISSLHLRGRFAVYDPTLLDPSQLSALGVPDANALARTYSVQGYGSIVDGRYAKATGVHGLSGEGQDVLSPTSARNGVLDQLSTSTLLAPAPYFARPGGASTDVPARGPARGPGARRVAPGSTSSWYLGSPEKVSSVTVPIGAPRNDTLRLGLLTPGGTTEWRTAVTTRGGAVTATWPAARSAVAVEVHVGAPGAAIGVGPPVVTSNDGTLVLDGVLQGDVTAPHWRYDGNDGAFAVFSDRRAKPPLRLVPSGGRGAGSLDGAVLRRTSGAALAPSSAEVVSPHGAGVVRAVAAVPGWRATWQRVGPRGATHAAVPLPVEPFGVGQEVRVPAGRGIVTWHYDPPGFAAGAGATLAAACGIAALCVVASWRRRSAAGARRRAVAP